MALARALKTLRGWNPLRCADTALPAPMLLAAKLAVIYILVTGDIPTRPDPFAPFLSVYDALGPSSWLWPALDGLLVVAGLALLFGRAVRISSFFIGSVVLLSILSARGFYANSFVLFGLILLLIGLQERPGSRWVFRAQLVLIYFGAGLNKLLDPDWRNGRYFEFWTGEILELNWYGRLADVLPQGMLSVGMGWTTIAVELGLAVAFLFPAWTTVAVAAGLAFHLGMLVFTGGVVSWIFLYAMAVLYLTLARWPDPPVLVPARTAAGARWIRRLDLEARFQPVPSRGSRSLSRLPALLRFLAYNPVSYFAAALLFFAVRRPL